MPEKGLRANNGKWLLKADIWQVVMPTWPDCVSYASNKCRITRKGSRALGWREWCNWFLFWKKCLNCNEHLFSKGTDGGVQPRSEICRGVVPGSRCALALVTGNLSSSGPPLLVVDWVLTTRCPGDFCGAKVKSRPEPTTQVAGTTTRMAMIALILARTCPARSMTLAQMLTAAP
jgi:hypothetical protein